MPEVAEAESDVAGLLERERELERIRAALDSAADGGGDVLLVEGPSGIGKTALALTAGELARDRGMRVLRAVGSELERDFAFGVARQLFDPVLRAADPASRERLLDGAAGAASALMLDAGGSVGSEFATLHGLYWLLANLSDEQALLLMVDDAHCADGASLRFLAFLVSRLAELPVLLLLCACPREWAVAHQFATTASGVAARPLVPAALSREACSTLVRARLQQRVDDAFCRACHSATGGNPFLLGALLDELGDEPPPRLEAVLAIGPRAVTRSIAARLGTMSAAAHPVAAGLAVLGDGASVEELRTLTGLPADDVRGAADELERASVLARSAELRFAHPIVRNAVYGDLARDERDRLHRRAGRLLADAGAPGERVAAQLLASDPAGDASACGILRGAARMARESGASDTAVAYLRRALAEPCAEDERAELLAELAAAEALVDGPAAIATVRQALELAVDRDRYVEIASEAARLLSLVGADEVGLQTATDALSRLGDDDRDLRRRLQAAILAAAQQDHFELEELDGVEHEHGLGARMIQAMLVVGERGSDASAPALAERAQRLLLDGLLLQGDNGGAAFTGLVRVLIDADSALAIEWLDRGIDRARAEGDVGALGADLALSCLAHARRGALDDAVRDGRDGLEAIERWGGQTGRVSCVTWLADAQTEATDLDGTYRERVSALVDEDLALARRWGAPGPLGAALRARALIDGDEALMRESVAVLEGSICRLEHAKSLVELGALLRRAGRRREAREPLQEGLDVAVACGAAPLAARAQEELRAIGASPRNAIRTGVDELTSSELRVAQLAASGRSNKQIAQELYVTVKTVETHLHRAYRKLDITSRAQLASALQ